MMLTGNTLEGELVRPTCDARWHCLHEDTSVTHYAAALGIGEYKLYNTVIWTVGVQACIRVSHVDMSA